MTRDHAPTPEFLRAIRYKGGDTACASSRSPDFSPEHSRSRIGYHLTLREGAAYLDRKAPKPSGEIRHGGSRGAGTTSSNGAATAGPRLNHHKSIRTEGHLFITALAYQLVQVIRTRLRAGGENASWTTLRRILEGQQRVTATFARTDVPTVHVRKATRAEVPQQALYDALGINSAPACDPGPYRLISYEERVTRIALIPG